MALISSYLQKILSAIYGKDVRQSIHDGIKAINDETEGTTTKQTQLENKFNSLIINAGNSNAENVAARVKANGTTYNTIGKRMDASDVQQDINASNINTNKNLIGTLSTKINSVVSGNPKGVYPTKSALDTAFPSGDTNIYVVLEDGGWYYWNNTLWIKGGTYQSSSIGEGTLKYDFFNNDVRSLLKNATPLVPIETSGKYINESGVIASSVGFKYTEPIKLLVGETIVLYAEGYLTNVAMICTCDDKNTKRTVKEVSIDSSARYYTYLATEDTYVVLSYHTAHFIEKWSPKDIQMLFKILDNKVNQFSIKGIADEVNITPSRIENKYFNHSGNITSINNPKFVIYEFEAHEGELYKITGSYTESSRAIMLKDKNGALIDIYPNTSIDTTTTEELTQSLRIPKDCIVSVGSSLGGVEIKIEPTLKLNDEALKGSIDRLGYGKSVEYYYLYNKVLCIGDSLTDGAYYSPELVGKQSIIDYPLQLSKMLSAEVTNAGKNGATAASWYKNEKSKYDFTKFDTFIIWLGTNEGLSDTIDTDTANDNFAESNTGYYCKLVHDILADNPYATIFLCSVFSSSGDIIITNSVINKIATKYNVNLVIDMNDGTLYPNDFLHPFGNTVHFGKYGNIVLADKIFKKINSYAKDNPLKLEKTYKYEI